MATFSTLWQDIRASWRQMALFGLLGLTILFLARQKSRPKSRDLQPNKGRLAIA